MQLTQNEFNVLVYLSELRCNYDEEVMAKEKQLPIEETRKIICSFKEKGFVKDGFITALGHTALEPYRVKRAIFMAAGFGSRMVPITLNVPKPLVRVNGVRIIETLLDAVVAAGISEIYIIRGYLGEQFNELLNKYPMIRFIENPFFNDGNNIISVACAGELLKNAYIIESDLVLYNPKLIQKYQYRSNYLAIPMKKTEDWCLYVENGNIKKIGQGGTDCHQIVGISYWTETDGARLVGHIKEVIQSPGGKNRLWGQVPLVCKADQYQVGIRECRLEDVLEIDSYSELKAIDKSYDV